MVFCKFVVEQESREPLGFSEKSLVNDFLNDFFLCRLFHGIYSAFQFKKTSKLKDLESV